MPNWVTTKIFSTPEVIKAMVNKDNGRIDFELVAPFPGNFPWAGVSLRAEEMAKIVTGTPVDSHPLIAAMQRANRAKAKFSDISDEDFEQFIQMLRNHRKCGYLHQMDFARAVWGTKWNAHDSRLSDDQTEASFDTAWSCPEPVLIAVSRRSPEAEIRVTYADEDIGSNCGIFILKGGEMILSDIAPAWGEQSPEEKIRWAAFARGITGIGLEEE